MLFSGLRWCFVWFWSPDYADASHLALSGVGTQTTLMLRILLYLVYIPGLR
jgi:hypothetical protein